MPQHYLLSNASSAAIHLQILEVRFLTNTYDGSLPSPSDQVPAPPLLSSSEHSELRGFIDWAQKQLDVIRRQRRSAGAAAVGASSASLFAGDDSSDSDSGSDFEGMDELPSLVQSWRIVESELQDMLKGFQLVDCLVDAEDATGWLEVAVRSGVAPTEKASAASDIGLFCVPVCVPIKNHGCLHFRCVCLLATTAATPAPFLSASPNLPRLRLPLPPRCTACLQHRTLERLLASALRGHLLMQLHQRAMERSLGGSSDSEHLQELVAPLVQLMERQEGSCSSELLAAACSQVRLWRGAQTC